MKLQKFFNRDKTTKLTRVTPLGRDIDAAAQHIIDEPAISAHHGSFAPPTPLHSAQTQPRDASRPFPRHSADDHWDVLTPVPSDDANHVSSPRPHPQQFIAPVIPSSRSSSLASLPQPGNSPQVPNAVPTSPRPSSPFSIPPNAVSVQGVSRNQKPDDRASRKRSPPLANSVTALGILRALDPHQDVPVMSHPPDPSDDNHTYTEPARIEKEKKEKKGFWDGMLRDRDKERWKAQKETDRERERERLERVRDRREDDLSTAELTRMIGYLTATASEDWSIVLEVCERASASETNAREAAKALRREFKYAEPKAQLAAARLWAIMLRNASEVFIQQISQRKFIEALEEVLTSPRTSPVVRERLMEVLAAAAFITSSRSQSAGKDKDGFRALWVRLKPADKPEAGIPFDTDDAMFSPPVAPLRRPSSQYSLETPIFAQTFSGDELSTTPPPIDRSPSRRRYQQRVIPPEEDIRRLFQECSMARGNADVLTQTLAFTKPDASDADDLIPEFLSKCRASQELIYTQIPWATAGAERSRAEKAMNQHLRTRSVAHETQLDPLANTEDVPDGPTVEEKLLAALLDANEALLGSLRMYDDLARVAAERATEEKSKKEVRMDRRQLNDDYYAEPPGPHTGSSDVPSPQVPSPTAPQHQHFELPPVVPSPNHPLPRIPPSITPSPLSQIQPPGHHYSSQTNTPTLLVPPHPIGPRSPSQALATSRTPSPDRMLRRTGKRQGSGDSEKERVSEVMERLNIENEGPYSDDETRTPIQPSAKALGKRRVVEEPEDGESNTAFLGRNDPYRDSGVDSDSDDAGYFHRRAPTRYVYDAAAERTAQLRERLVNGVH